ncbi:MAG TPA: hypothetical protein P5256_02740 [Beijerinckiaceae bacterium]|nr:hypothetical protein [Rhodoblastus sp.]HRY02014.1 hypothetical protein [Beijerinckiaceae bacterium]
MITGVHDIAGHDQDSPLAISDNSRGDMVERQARKIYGQANRLEYDRRSRRKSDDRRSGAHGDHRRDSEKAGEEREVAGRSAMRGVGLQIEGESHAVWSGRVCDARPSLRIGFGFH